MMKRWRRVGCAGIVWLALVAPAGGAGEGYVERDQRMSLGTEQLMLELLKNGPALDKMRAAMAFAAARVASREVVDGLRKHLSAEMPQLRAAIMQALGRTRRREVLKDIIAGCRDEYWQVRMDALLALREFAPDREAAAAALAALKDDDRSVRLAALQALAVVAGEPEVKPLLAYLKEEDSERHRAAALRVLVARGLRPGPEAVRPYATSKDPQVRTAAFEVVGLGLPLRGETEAALRDPHAGVRRAAVRAWEALRGAAAAEAGVAACRDVDDTVRETAAQVLGRVGDKTSLEALWRLQEDPYRHVRRAASESLVALAAPERGLRSAIVERAVRDTGAGVQLRRLEALFVLGMLQETEVVPAVAKVAAEYTEMPEKRLFIWLAGQCDGQDSAPEVVKAINAADGALRLHGAMGVGLLKYEPAVPVIKSTLAKTESTPAGPVWAYGGRPRTELFRSLVMMDVPAVVPVLLKQAGSTRPLEGVGEFRIAVTYLVGKKAGGLADMLKKVYGAKEVSDEHKRFIVDTLKVLTGSDQGLDYPEKREGYDTFFLESRDR